MVWKNDKAHFTLTGRQADAGAIALCADGRTLYTAGYVGTQAVVWKDADLLYTLTDGSSSAEATAVCRSGSALYAAGYQVDGFENEGVVWKNGRELYDLSDGSAQGSLPYAIAVYGDDVFSAGTLFGTSRTAVVWHGEEILHTLTDGTGPRRSLFDERRAALQVTGFRTQSNDGTRLSGRVPFFMPSKTESMTNRKTFVIFADPAKNRD